MTRMLSGLKDCGFITKKVGRGTYVSERVADVVDAATTGFRGSVSPADLMGADLVLDPAIQGDRQRQLSRFGSHGRMLPQR